MLIAVCLPACTPLSHLNEVVQLTLKRPFRLESNNAWRLSGDAKEINGGEAVRLTEDGKTSARGGMWATEAIANTGGEWEVTLSLNIWGSGETYFGDGMALWLTEQPSLTGKVFGARDYWKGLGILFDTYDNGQQSTTHPFISVFVNDGTQSYVHGDGGNQQGIPACHSLFRNEQNGFPTEVKVRKVGERVMVDVNLNSLGSWTRCVDVDNVKIPDEGYYFGITSSTGDLTDNHQVHGFTLRTKVANPVATVESESEIQAEEDMARQVDGQADSDKSGTNVEQDDDVARIVEQSQVTQLLKTQGEEHDIRIKSIRTHLVEQIRGLTGHLDSMTGKLKQQEEDLVQQLAHLEKIGHIEIDDALMAHRDGTHWFWPFLGLSIVVCAGAGLLHRRFAAVKKKHLL